ncbi:MAG: hypothetical protein V4538_11635 [Bacteroidota bacterium]
MSTFQFMPPANIQDFANDASNQAALISLWNNNINGFIQQGMMGNPWNATNAPVPTNYFNPLVNNPDGQIMQAIPWPAFPGRLAYNYPTLTQVELFALADTGLAPADINNNPCNTATGNNVPYFPYGPRGWQDEYCEWAVTRNSEGKITRIDFTCENPEYYNSVWLISPQKVLELYQNTLNKPQIVLNDLCVLDSENNPVINPSTGQPLYNPLNKWNIGSNSTAKTGGAMHLTSTPNTIQTEIGLACASSVQRNGTFTDNNALLCCGQYGQPHRNSDPTIGAQVNAFVGEGYSVTLANPPGLYIQTPDFSSYVAPDNADCSEFWTIVRGAASMDGMPGNFILHAVFEVPSSKPYVVGDILIGKQKISWGSQVTNTFFMHIVAAAYSSSTPQSYSCVGTPTPDRTFAQPLQLFYETVYNAMYPSPVPNPVRHPIALLSNSTYIAPFINQGTTANMVITADTCTAVAGNASTYPTITFDGTGITATVNSVAPVTYAVPGNSQPSTYTALFVTVTVAANATQGYRSLSVANVGQSNPIAMPALLNVL